MLALYYIGIVFLAAFAMEYVAWLAHKYLMHGLLWSWHEDHHKPHTKEGFFEKNDLFFIVFAILSASCYFLGSLVPELRELLFIGIGISVYGLIYFLIHDVYIHQRFKWFRQLDSKFSRAILRAHGAHHANQEKDASESFGLLLVHPKYFKKRRKNTNS